jgi:isopenicillin N synthase-like dioxygenase
MLSRCPAQLPLPTARCFSQIPVIDVSPLIQAHSSLEDKQHAAAALHEAARRVGFFYAANTGVPAQLSQDILKQARQWFDLPVRSSCTRPVLQCTL